MAIKPRPLDRRIEIDLTGPEGNAHYLLALANRYAQNLEIDPEPILADMKSGSYEHLIQAFDKYFGHFVTLYR